MRAILKKLALVATAALISSTSVDAQSSPIKLLASPSIYTNMYDQIVKEYNSQSSDSKIMLLPTLREDEELVQNVLRGTITGNLPDVVLVSNIYMRLIVDRGIAVPLDKCAWGQGSLEKSGVIPGTLDVGKLQGVQYGLPLGTSIPVVAFNAELVSRAGGDLSNLPNNWTDILALAKKINTLGSNISGGFFEYDNTANWTYQALVGSFGGKMMSKDEKVISFIKPKGVKALTVLKKFGEDAGQAQIDMTRDQARQSFASGTLGLIVTSSGTLVRLEKNAGNKFKVRAMPFPLSSADGRVPPAGEVIMILAKDAARQKAACDFVKYAVGPDAQTIVGQSSGLLSINHEALSDPKRLGNQLKERPNLSAAIDRLSSLTNWYAFPGENAIKITEVIKHHLQSVVTLQETPEMAAQSMGTEVQSLLPKH